MTLIFPTDVDVKMTRASSPIHIYLVQSRRTRIGVTPKT
jgi:hypothetical protein